jgi:L-asparaginase
VTVHVIATGGTISSHFEGEEWTNIDGAGLVGELGPDVAGQVVVSDVASGPSSNLTVHDMLAIVDAVRAALAAGAEGVVVVHGTDTMELTAFLCQLSLGVTPDRRPVVFTGSMRVHSHPAPDGTANLRDAIAVGCSPLAVGREVMVCMEGTLHAADRVTKCHAASVDAFQSAPFAPIGSVVDGVPVFRVAAVERPAATGFVTEVPLITSYPGIDAAVAEAALAGVTGAVVEGFGDLNVPQQLWAPIHHAWNRGALVVLASRPFTPTTATGGLSMLGAVGAGGLTAQKARLAVMAALGTTPDRNAALAFLHQLALTFDAGDRSTS